jgi:hypothetical protein
MTAHMHVHTSRSLQCCGNCDAFVPNKAANPASGQPRQGACCANPPSLMQGAAPVPGSQLSPAGPQMMSVIQGAWPPTDATRWCRGWDEIEKDSNDD